MVSVIYNGDINPCNIKIFSTIIKGWGKGEIKELSQKQWDWLKKNENFSLASKKRIETKKEPVKKKEEEKKEDFHKFDLDRDGDVDKDDYSLAAKTLANARK